MTRYARAFGGGWLAAAQLPLVVVLLALWNLEDIERRERLVTEADAVRDAFFTNYALLAPTLLQDADRALTRRMATNPHAIDADGTPADAALVAQALADARASNRGRA